MNVNEQDAFGETALHLACMEGARIPLNLPHGTPYRKRGAPRCAQHRLFLGHQVRLCQFISGQYKVVRMLVVEQHARVDLQNWEGWVAMIWAIVRGHVQIVKFLSERVRPGNFGNGLSEPCSAKGHHLFWIPKN